MAGARLPLSFACSYIFLKTVLNRYVLSLLQCRYVNAQKAAVERKMVSMPQCRQLTMQGRQATYFL